MCELFCDKVINESRIKVLYYLFSLKVKKVPSSESKAQGSHTKRFNSSKRIEKFTITG